MKLPKQKLFATAVFSLAAAAVLMACGGGSNPPPSAGGNPVDPVSEASIKTATAIGAETIAGASADEKVYNMAADIGDSWQLVLNNKTNTYVMKVLSTQYGLVSTAAASFTKTTVGSLTTIKSSTGTALAVQIDELTNTLAGNATVGTKRASVSGSGYKVAGTSLLAGNYFFMGATRNVSNGLFRDNPIGSFVVAANGTDITACDRGIVVNGACAAVPNSGAQTINSKLLKVSKDSATGLLMVKDGVKDFGVLHVHAGDRGPVLILDRFGFNDENVLRAGVIFAGKAVKLAGTEFNGTFNCSINGVDSANVVVTGAAYTVKDLERNTSTGGTLLYNKVVSGDGLSTIDLNGAAIAQNAGETLSQTALVLPLSSSLAVVSHDGVLDICRRAS